jgi:hypothetical protein
MNNEITTLKEAERAIQELIDSFSDDIFIEACEEMESAAQVAREARQAERET